MQVSLAGRIVVITGAASGVGAAVARAAQGAGAAGLVLTDRDGAGLAAVAAELGAATHVADLADPAAPPGIIDAALARFGRIDGLVNAAALTTRAGFPYATLDQWDALFAVNAAGIVVASLVVLLLRKATGKAEETASRIANND